MTTQKFRLFVFLALPITTLFFLLFTKTKAIDVNVTNRGQVINTVNTSANTGNNQTNGGSITTGDANAGSVVTNVVNTNVVKNCCGTPTPKPTEPPGATPTPTPIAQTPTPTPTGRPTPTPTQGSSNDGGGGGNNPGNGGSAGGTGGASISPQAPRGEVLGLSATSGEISASQFIAQLTQPVTVNATTTRIVIPRLGINLPVVEAPIVNGLWQVSENSASHGAGSANPGEAGNAVIFAHAREGLFAPLRNVAVRDEIYVLTKDKWLRYTVSATTLVRPDETGVVAPTADERLTLFTCSGFADSKRLIVTAQPVAL